MQSCFLNSGLRLSELRTKHALAVHFPHRRCIGFGCVRVAEEEEEEAAAARAKYLQPTCCLYDGYTTRGVRLAASSCNLLEFMRIALQHYQLSDYHAQAVLRFFKFNIAEAVRQMEGAREQRLDIDVPWRLQVKAISELPGLDLFNGQTLYKSRHGVIYMNRHQLCRCFWSQLPWQPARCLRIQRCYFKDQALDVCCLLSQDQATLQVVGLLLPTDQQHWPSADSLMLELTQYVAPLVLATQPASGESETLNAAQSQPKLKSIVDVDEQLSTTNDEIAYTEFVKQMIIQVISNDADLIQTLDPKDWL